MDPALAARLAELGFVRHRPSGMLCLPPPAPPVSFSTRWMQRDGEDVAMYGFGLGLSSGSLLLTRSGGSADVLGADVLGDPTFDREYGAGGRLRDLALLTAPVRAVLCAHPDCQVERGVTQHIGAQHIGAAPRSRQQELSLIHI